MVKRMLTELFVTPTSVPHPLLHPNKPTSMSTEKGRGPQGACFARLTKARRSGASATSSCHSTARLWAWRGSSGQAAAVANSARPAGGAAVGRGRAQGARRARAGKGRSSMEPS